MELNEKQIDYIEYLLQENGLNYKPLKEDILDHFCCMVEQELNNGKSFQQSVQGTLAAFGENGIEELQKQTLLLINQKQLFMKRLAMLSTLIFLLSFSFLYAQKSSSFGNPLAEIAKVHADYGMRIHPLKKKQILHTGVDYSAKFGTPVLATQDGIVKLTKSNKTGYGNHIILEHSDSISTLYAHLSAIEVEEGQKIKKGEKIGEVGSSGSSSAPHLHYEVIKDGKKVNPRDYIQNP